MRQACALGAAIFCAGLVTPAASEVIELELAANSFIEKRLTVAAGKFAELCTMLRRDRVVAWQFAADAITDFNIHYHEGQRVTYPEQLSKVKDARGVLRVEMDQTYCWMWTNRSATPIAIEVTLNEANR